MLVSVVSPARTAQAPAMQWAVFLVKAGTTVAHCLPRHVWDVWPSSTQQLCCAVLCCVFFWCCVCERAVVADLDGCVGRSGGPVHSCGWEFALILLELQRWSIPDTIAASIVHKLQVTVQATSIQVVCGFRWSITEDACVRACGRLCVGVWAVRGSTKTKPVKQAARSTFADCAMRLSMIFWGVGGLHSRLRVVNLLCVLVLGSCSAGRYGSSAGLTTSACSGACAPGLYAAAGSTACSSCAPGFFQPYAEQGTCFGLVLGWSEL